MNRQNTGDLGAVKLFYTVMVDPVIIHLSKSVEHPNTKSKCYCGTSLVVPWLTLCSQCRGLGFDPWSRNQIPHATAGHPACHS